MAVDRRDAHGVGPQPLSPNVAGKRSRSICAGMANPTGRAKATIGWSASPAISRKCCNLPGQPALVGASLGGFAAMLLAGELSPGIASAVVLVDIVPNMDLAGASRIHAFMAERVESGFGSLDEVADVIANYNPHRPRPSDPDGLVANLRRRGDRWYWHWDPQFIGGIAAFPPVEVTDVDRMNAAVATILRDEVPVLLVRGQVSDIVRQESADQFLSRFPQVEFTDVRGAGHMVAGDRNDAFAGAVLDFLARHVGVR